MNRTKDQVTTNCPVCGAGVSQCDGHYGRWVCGTSFTIRPDGTLAHYGAPKECLMRGIVIRDHALAKVAEAICEVRG